MSVELASRSSSSGTTASRFSLCFFAYFYFILFALSFIVSISVHVELAALVLIFFTKPKALYDMLKATALVLQSASYNMLDFLPQALAMGKFSIYIKLFAFNYLSGLG